MLMLEPYKVLQTWLKALKEQQMLCYQIELDFIYMILYILANLEKICLALNILVEMDILRKLWKGTM